MKVMKDKLIKTGHKGLYYKMKKLSICSILFLTLGIAITIPTYYSNINVNGKATSAEKIDEEKQEENLPIEEDRKIDTSFVGIIANSGERNLISYCD